MPLSGGRLGLALTRVTASSSQKELSVLGGGRHPRIGGVEVGGDSELPDVDFRLALEAVPGGLEDALLLLVQGRKVGQIR